MAWKIAQSFRDTIEVEIDLELPGTQDVVFLRVHHQVIRPMKKKDDKPFFG